MPPRTRTPHPRRWAAVAVTTLALIAGCATTPRTPAAGTGAVIEVVAAENFWGSLAAQLGGDHAHVVDIIDNPAADPHDYEPTTADVRAISTAQLVIINGVGYDTWATKAADTDPADDRTVLTVGDLVGAPPGDNPHRWYNPDDVRRVIDAITADYQRIDPAYAAFFAARHHAVLDTDLRAYFDTIAAIRDTYTGTPVGASESIFAMLAPALGLRLLTPATFLRAISEGTDPTAADKATTDAQIHDHQIQVYVYNRQNATPDITEQVTAAGAAGIPVTTITETLTPAGATFQDWQVAQLDALRRALAQATGR